MGLPGKRPRNKTFFAEVRFPLKFTVFQHKPGNFTLSLLMNNKKIQFIVVNFITISPKAPFEILVDCLFKNFLSVVLRINHLT